MWQVFLVYHINTQSLESTKMKWVSSKMLIKPGQGVIPGLGHECVQQKALQHNKSRERERGRVRRENSASHWPTKELVRISPVHHPRLCILSVAEGVPLSNFLHSNNMVSSGLFHYSNSAFESVLLSGTDVVSISWLFSFLRVRYQQMLVGYLYDYYLLELLIKIYLLPSISSYTKN